MEPVDDVYNPLNFDLEHIDIEITSRCNLSCRHCSAQAPTNRGREELSCAEIKNILAAAKELGLKKVGLTGGEPLMDPRKLRDIAEYCTKNLEIPVHTHLNGTLVNDKSFGNGGVLSLFKDVSISFLGSSQETHDFMTTSSGSFKATFNAAKRLSSQGAPLSCYFIPTHDRCKGYGELMEQLFIVGIRRVRVMALAPSGRARSVFSNYFPRKIELERFEEEILSVGNRLGMKVEAGNCTRLSMPRLAVLEGHGRCFSGENRLHINSKGDVFPCTASSGVKELKLGNLRDNNYDIRDIWQRSDLLKKIRLMHSNQLESCATCTRSQMCNDDCLVKTIGVMTEVEKAHCPIVLTETMDISTPVVQKLELSYH
jgi:radical SAM protein with 4Fe4S-binding SPASM domain